MSMNFLDALRIINAQVSGHNGNTDLWMALDEIEDLIAAYDALAPKPDAWPDGAEWYTIDANGYCYWHRIEPSEIRLGWESGTAAGAGVVLIPLGVDWRLLKWQRPEVAA